MVTWSVSFETTLIERGTAATKEEAEREARLAHDVLVVRGFNPDSLAYHVGAPHDRPFGVEPTRLIEPFCACGRVISRCDHSRRGCS